MTPVPGSVVSTRSRRRAASQKIDLLGRFYAFERVEPHGEQELANELIEDRDIRGDALQ